MSPSLLRSLVLECSTYRAEYLDQLIDFERLAELVTNETKPKKK